VIAIGLRCSHDQGRTSSPAPARRSRCRRWTLWTFHAVARALCDGMSIRESRGTEILAMPVSSPKLRLQKRPRAERSGRFHAAPFEPLSVARVFIYTSRAMRRSLFPTKMEVIPRCARARLDIRQRVRREAYGVWRRGRRKALPAGFPNGRIADGRNSQYSASER